MKSDVIPVTNVEKVTFDFSYKNWLQSITIKGKDFTNKLYNEKQYSEMITTLFSKLVPYIQEHWKDIKVIMVKVINTAIVISLKMNPKILC